MTNDFTRFLFKKIALINFFNDQLIKNNRIKIEKEQKW